MFGIFFVTFGTPSDSVALLAMIAAFLTISALYSLQSPSLVCPFCTRLGVPPT